MAIRTNHLSQLPIRGVLAVAIRCAQRVLPLAYDTPIHSSLARAIYSASLTSSGKSSRKRVDVGIADYGQVPKDRQVILNCLASIHDSLVECDFHVLSYFTALRESDVAADNLADATHDADAFTEDRERAEATIDSYGSLSADAAVQAVYAKEKAIEAAAQVLTTTHTVVFESAAPDLHTDFESLGNQHLRGLLSSVEADIDTILGKFKADQSERFAIHPKELGDLWSGGMPEWGDDSSELDSITEVSPPIFTIIWDPELVTEDEYADIVAAVGDIVRSEGGVGLERLRSEGYGVVCNVEVQS